MATDRDLWLSAFLFEGHWMLRLSLSAHASVQYVSEIGEALPDRVRKLEQMREHELARGGVMIVELTNLVTGERMPVVAETPREAVVTAAAEDRVFGDRKFQSFRQLSRATKRAALEAAHLRKHEVRRGRIRVFCGNWMAELGG